MASVSSLDKDLRNLRLDKYTPAAANETRSWIESILGERLPGNDVLDGLKDGIALCKLVNLAIGPPGVKFKTSAMPFVQMENISHFLRACQSPPLNLPDHDMFLTVDLYEQKDPTQVLQCLSAFSRAAQRVNPSAFPSSIGRSRGNVLSPQSTGGPSPNRNRGMSTASNTSSMYGGRPNLVSSRTGDSGSGRWSPTKSPTGERVGSPGVSSWSKRDHEGVTSPAWNIAQYGYMGGASQGNLGISFGGRRQITSAGPNVPSMAERERRRQEEEAEAERQRFQMEEQERMRQEELEAEEERQRLEEERRWKEESRKQREAEKRQAEEEKRRWEEEERQWKLTEEKRRKEEEEAEAKLVKERQRTRSKSNAQLQGQFLSQYQVEQGLTPQKSGGGYGGRVQELERELELAREREREYEEERERRGRGDNKSRNRSRSRPRPTSRPPSRPQSRQESWSRDEREYLRTQWDRSQEEPSAFASNSPLPARPLPEPTAPLVKSHRTGEAPPPAIKSHRTGEAPPPAVKSHRTGEAPPPAVKSHRTGEAPPPMKSHRPGEGRPLPIPDRVRNHATGGYGTSPTKSTTSSSSSNTRPLPNPAASSSRTDRYPATRPAPITPPKPPTYSRELGATAERDAEDRRRMQSQAKTKAGGKASKSLLEREMELERQRQQEWEDAQKETAKAPRTGDGVDGIGGGVGGKWDVSQWSGYTGGDSQNKGGAGIGSGRRQIVGPRPLPGRP